MTNPKPTGQQHGRAREVGTTQGLMLRGIALFAACLLVVTTVGALAARSRPSGSGAAYTGTAVLRELGSLRRSLDRASGDLELMQLELARARALLDYSARYHIPADLAALIYDTALREGLDPDLAFRLVKVESNFNPLARSSAEAVGLAQVQLRTARFYQSGITMEQLLEPATNLSIGFRYLRDLLGTYQGDLRLALLAYNRGPAKVNQLLEGGREPGNGYAKTILSPTASRRR
jgi:soluble lytic murein transglycosylase-like protein